MAEDLRQRTARGFAWGLANQGSMQVLNVVFGIVLGRLLSPDDYGIVGVLSVFSMIASNLQQCGFWQGLVNLPKPRHRDYNSVFWFNVTTSAVIYIVLFLAAPLIVQFFHEPRLLWVSRLVFIGFLISSAGVTPGAYMAKHLMVKETAVIGFVALLCSGTMGILLALAGYSYWSLAWQQVVFIAVSIVGRYVVVPFRPSLHITMEPVRRMFRFSINIMFTTLVTSISTNLLTFIFGRMLPMAQVGNYSQANKWSVTACETMRGTVAGIAQPVLKEVGDDAERTLRVLRKLIRVTSFLSFPALFGLALVSEEFIMLALGEKWRDSAQLLAMLAVGGSVLPLYALLQNVLVSHGRSARYLWISAVQVAVQVAIALLVIHRGMRDVVLALTVYNLLYLFVWHYAVKHLSGYTMAAMMRDVLPYSIAALAAITATYWTTTACMGSDSSAALVLAARVATAATIYIATLWCAGAAELREAIEFVRHKKSRSV